MRVGISAANLRSGGGLTHLVELLTAADPDRDDFERVTVWARRDTLDWLPRREWLVAEEPPVLRGAGGQARWLLGGAAREAARHADILLVPGTTHIGRFAPVVAISQNMLPFDQRSASRYGWSPKRARLALLRLLHRRTLGRSEGVIYLTETARAVIGAQVDGADIPAAVIPHGVAPAFRAAPREQRPLAEYSAERPFRLLYVSTVEVYKHQVELARAVARLRQQGLPIALELVGPAYLPEQRRLERHLRELGAGAFVRLRGPVSSAVLPTIYSSADAFVFASSCENMPIILLEAMASALPIACSSRSVMPEVLGDAGIYFDPEDPDALDAALRTLVTDPGRRAVLANGARARSEAYTWERCAEATFRFLHHVLQRHRGFPHDPTFASHHQQLRF